MGLTLFCCICVVTSCVALFKGIHPWQNEVGVCRRHDARPAAKEALQDPWLQGNSLERTQGKPLDATVVQRLQVMPLEVARLKMCGVTLADLMHE